LIPFEYQSPHAIAPEQKLMAFISAVVVRASRFRLAGWLRHNKAFHALLRVKRFPGEDAIRRFFHDFTPAHIEAFWRPLWSWMLELLQAPKEGFSLDLDSTVFSCEGGQEGAAPTSSSSPLTACTLRMERFAGVSAFSSSLQRPLGVRPSSL
jgi:hypothetical protein